MLVETDDLMSLSEAATASGFMSESVLRGHVRRGNVKHVKIGSALFVTRAALDELLKKVSVQ